MTLIPKQPKPIRSPNHLRNWVAQHWCIVCSEGNLIFAGYVISQAAHIRIGFFGKGCRPCDSLTTPLCPDCHQQGPDAQHDSNETEWWKRKGIDPFKIARELTETSPCKKIKEALTNGTHS